MQNKIFYSNFQLGFNKESDLFKGELFTVFVTLKFKKKKPPAWPSLNTHPTCSDIYYFEHQ